MSCMSIEDEKDLNKIVGNILDYATTPSSQRIMLKASLNLFYSKGYRNGYNDAMNDAKAGKDQRVVAHLN